MDTNPSSASPRTEDHHEPTSGFRVILVTAPDREAARALAHAVVGERLAACATLIPGAASVYRWEGEVQEEEEVLLILKTTAEAAGALRERVLDLHSYEVPEVLALPVAEGHGEYLRWVREEVGGGGAE